MTPAESGRVLAGDAAAVSLAHEPVAVEDVVAGTPSTATLPLGDVAGAEVGIWEITPGTVRDTEVDELFVVLSGDGTVRFEDGSSVELGQGVVVRLHAGERTEWEIRTTLRKVYVAG